MSPNGTVQTWIESFAFAKEAVEGDTDLPPFVFAQYKYALMEEMIVKPVDFFIRRTGALFFNIDWVRRWKDLVIAEMAKDLKWTEEEKKMHTEELAVELRDAVTPIDGKNKCEKKQENRPPIQR